MQGERDFDTQPYSADEQRVEDYLTKLFDGHVGIGDDPIGFLMAFHETISEQRMALADAHTELVEENIKLRFMQETFYYLCKWVERGLYDNISTAKEALSVIAHHPGMPWKEGRWDVDHKTYAEAFYKAFPKAKSG